MRDDPSWTMKHALKLHLGIDANKDTDVGKLLRVREEGAEVNELEHDTLTARLARKKKVPRISLWMARKDVFDAVERSYPFPYAHEIEVSCFHRKHPSPEEDPGRRFARRMIGADHMQFLGGRSEVNYRAGMNPLRDLIHDDEMDHERFRELACAIGEVTWLNSALHSIRRFWFPPASAGSQTEDFEQQAALAEAIRTACEARIAQQKAWDDEDGDEGDDANQS